MFCSAIVAAAADGQTLARRSRRGRPAVLREPIAINAAQAMTMMPNAIVVNTMQPDGAVPEQPTPSGMTHTQE